MISIVIKNNIATIGAKQFNLNEFDRFEVRTSDIGLVKLDKSLAGHTFFIDDSSDILRKFPFPFSIMAESDNIATVLFGATFHDDVYFRAIRNEDFFRALNELLKKRGIQATFLEEDDQVEFGFERRFIGTTFGDIIQEAYQFLDDVMAPLNRIEDIIRDELKKV